jgi:beta-carotene 3-hydroxylase
MTTVLLAFLAMEAVSYLAHRFVMHGVGMALHRSHHSALATRFEANDLFPVSFAAVTILAMAAGATLPSLHVLFTVGIGVTLYGAAYAFVHDVYIHARLGRLPRVGLFEHLKAAHRIHHLYGGEPFGMLLPVVPRRLRERALAASYDPFDDGRTSRAATASFSHAGTRARFEKTS